MSQTETETMTTVPETETQEAQETERDPIEIIATEFLGAPDIETMLNWKSHYGTIYAFTPDNDNVFIFRPLKRLEHKNITRDIKQISETQAAQINPAIVEEHLHEKVVTSCCLHPQITLDTFNNSPAGLIPTLFNLVMENSKFIAPERALASCFKL